MIGKEFVREIIDLAKNESITKDGIEYVTKRLYPIEKPMAKSLSVKSLEGVVEFVKNTMGQEKISYPLVINVEHDQVDVYSQLGPNLERDYLLSASPMTPSLELGRWLDVENFIIKLQTCYEETDNRIALLKLVGNFVKNDSLEVKDDGFSQKVTVQSGVATSEIVDVPPILMLKPYRTFGEIEQVETLYLCRVNKNTNVALYEADGGQWKNTARKRIVNFLKESLGDLIKDETVVVIG